MTMNRNRQRFDSSADRALAALIRRTDWSDIARRLLLYVLERLVREGAIEDRYRKAKAFVEKAIAQFFDHRHEFILVSHEKLFGCLCVIADCLVRDDAEEERKKEERSAPAHSCSFSGTDEALEESMSIKWSTGRKVR
jgi:hypothetical protein